jgi:hypothetical protein
METIKVKRKITSSQIGISEVKKFIGKQVEITVTEKNQGKRTLNFEAAGILEKFKNSGLFYAEKEAWNIAVNDKHGNY